ncbi:discoidin domain-containing protein [Bremerella sp. JC770]|uniref:discoidin domain-containing protein n=1 Tax=Bremerella sp. JC770 TaxID=3232137 RepID=UPI003459B990
MARITSIIAISILLLLVAGSIGWLVFDGLTTADSPHASSRLSASWIRTVNPRVAQLEKRIATINAELSRLVPYTPKFPQRGGFHSSEITNTNTPPWVQVDLGARMPIESVVLVPVSSVNEGKVILDYGLPRQFEVQVSDQSDFSSFEMIQRVDYPNAQTREGFPIVIDLKDVSGRYVRLVALELYQQEGQKFLALDELMVLSGGRNVAIHQKVTASSQEEIPLRWSNRYLVDTFSVMPIPLGAEASPSTGLVVPGDYTEYDWVTIRMQFDRPREITEIQLYPYEPSSTASAPGWGFPLRFFIKYRAEENERFQTLLDYTDNDLYHWKHDPLVVSVSAPLHRTPFPPDASGEPGEEGTYPLASNIMASELLITSTRHDSRFMPSIVALSEIQVITEQGNIAPEADITVSIAKDQIDPQRIDIAALTDGYNSRRRILEWPQWLPQVQKRGLLLNERDDLLLQLDEATSNTMQNTAWISAILLIASIAVSSFLIFRRELSSRRQLALVRKQLSKDLHDEIGSNLATIAMLAKRMRRTYAGEQRLDEVEQIDLIVNDTTSSIRDMMYLLENDRSDLLEFTLKLQEIARRMLVNYELAFVMGEYSQPVQVSNLWQKHVLLIQKEILANIVSHSHAHAVSITMAYGKEFELVVRDDGCGIPSSRQDTKESYGLRNIQDRVKRLGGTVAIITSDQGTEIVVTIPCC